MAFSKNVLWRFSFVQPGIIESMVVDYTHFIMMINNNNNIHYDIIGQLPF